MIIYFQLHFYLRSDLISNRFIFEIEVLTAAEAALKAVL